jgi:hypothetical protein
MRSPRIVCLGLLITTTILLLSLGMTEGTSARAGDDRIPTASEIRGRFPERDTGSLINRYNYADNNPISNQDPSGH